MWESLSLGLILTLLVDTVLRVTLAVRIVMRRRAVPVSLAWLCILLFAPLAGAALYLLVGEARLGRRRAIRHARIVESLRPLEDRLWRARVMRWTVEGDRAHAAGASLSRLATEATGLPAVAGNDVRIMTDDDWIDAVVADVDAATTQVHVLTFIWMVGGAGDRLATALVRARARGVECRVLADAVGSRRFLRGPVAEDLRREGVEVRAALPASIFRLPFARLDLRNHRKIAVIDGAIAHVGSHNVTDATFRIARRPGIGPWIDASLRVEGPAAGAADFVFLQDWMLAGDESVDAEPLEPLASPPPDPGGVALQLIPSGPGPVPHAIHEMIQAAIWSASEELILTTPYFVPDEATRIALLAAARRGVRTTLVVPRRGDAILVSLAAASHYDELLGAGVTIARHGRGLLHAKTLVVDRRAAIVGSANLDVRSFWLNFELTVLALDSDFASQVRWLQDRYLAESETVDPAAWAARSGVRRFAEGVARLFGPLL